jgi:hypothetical protein
MPIEHLTELQYSQDRRGPFKLYIYERDSEYHRGGVWFGDEPRYEDEITVGEALSRVEQALEEKREVRICDRGDLLVYHARGGKVLYPNNPEAFWEEIVA